jgi:hypothetical protein
MAAILSQEIALPRGGMLFFNIVLTIIFVAIIIFFFNFHFA